MPDNPEVNAIESGYADHVKAVFTALINKLISQPVTHMTDRQCADEFALAIKTAQRAKKLALDVVGRTSAVVPGSAIAAAATPKRAKPARPRKGK
jgi:hypothetical protein